jgi:hypothetical protein
MRFRHDSRTARALSGLVVAGVLSLAFSVLARAASPASGTLSPSSGPIAWDSFGAVAAASPQGETTCVESVNCDTFTLHLAPGDYHGLRVRYRASWTNQLNEYDLYVHQGGIDGPVIETANPGAPGTGQTAIFDINDVVVAGYKDTYSIRIVYWAVVAMDPLHGVLTVEPIPATPTRTATFVTGAKTGISFSRSRPLYAFGAGQDVEPNARVDLQGNAYVGGIRGLTGGDDMWRFDLNPGSPTYDPFLLAATPTFDASGNVANPAWKGQPDATAPTDPSDLGGDGGGDMDIAIARNLALGAAEPTVATTSLLAANISAQRSEDRGDTFLKNPAGNAAVPVDDRNWMEFLGEKTVYLAYRELAGLVATSKFYVNRSDDGGLTYGPPVVAAVGGNTTGNIDIDQRDGTIYFCRQGVNANEVMVAVGEPVSLAVPPVVYNSYLAAAGKGNSIAALFPVCKVASDGTVYVAYSDDGNGIFVTHSFDHGRTWAPPVQVSDMGPNGVALMPWIAPGDRPGSLAVVWYGATAADSEDGRGGNTNNSNWKVFYAQTMSATSSSPTVLQTVASDHFNHASNVSVLGLSDNAQANRNLADFFQVALDPQGLAFIAFADDSNDFAGHTYVTHQIAGVSLNTGKTVKIRGSNTPPPVATTAPQVFDFLHDARIASPPPVMLDEDNPADILTVAYACQTVNGSPWLSATMRLSGLDVVPPHGTWRMNFATNPTKPGIADRGDQWFLQAATDDQGARSFSYGTATRDGGGGFTYTVVGAADAGDFDLTSRSVTVKVNVAKLNAIQKHGAITSKTPLIGLRGSALVERYAQTVQIVTVTAGLSDSTRGGGTFTMGTCPQ